VINPPRFVWDGTYTDTLVERPDGTKALRPLKNYTEDPQEALRKVISNTVSIIAKEGTNIESGKRGNTTTVVYSDADDGRAQCSSGGYLACRTATTAGSWANTNSYNYLSADATNLSRVPLAFDTSSIPATDTVSSATLTIEDANDAGNSDGWDIGVVQSTQAVWNAITVNDFEEIAGDSISAPTEGATRQPIPSSNGVVVFTLNADGIDWISKDTETEPVSASATGKTQLSLRLEGDMDNVLPTGSNFTAVSMSEDAVDAPFLTIEHAAGGGSGTSTATSTSAYADQANLMITYVLAIGLWVGVFLLWLFLMAKLTL